MFNFFKALSFLIIFNQTQVYASWDESHRQLASQFRLEYKDQVSAMIWALQQKPDTSDYSKKDFKIVNIPSTHTEKQYVPVKLGLQKNQNGQILKAPLYIMISGLHADHLTDVTTTGLMFKQGYHVVSLPTGWSEAYQLLKPDFKMGDLESEASASYEVIQKLVEDLHRSNCLTSVSYFAYSYGAILAPFLAQLDRINLKPIIDGPYTLVGPEENIAYSINVFNEVITTHASSVDSLPKQLLLLVAANRYKKAKSPVELSDKDVSRAKSMMAFATNHRLMQVMKTVFPDFAKSPQAKGKAYYRFNYGAYVQQFAPELLETYSGPKGSFVYNINMAKNMGASHFRILTTSDDFLNSLEVWSPLGDDVLILNGGSHVGFIGTNWYQQFLNKLFEKVNSNPLIEIFKKLLDSAAQ